MGRERKLEAMYWGSGLDGLVFSTRDNAIILETNVEVFIRVEILESSPETETDFVPFDCMHKSGVPLPSLACSCRLNEDLVADQHAGALLRQTRDRKASGPINFSPRWKDENTNKWNLCRYSSLVSGISNFSRSRLCTC